MAGGTKAFLSLKAFQGESGVFLTDSCHALFTANFADDRLAPAWADRVPKHLLLCSVGPFSLTSICWVVALQRLATLQAMHIKDGMQVQLTMWCKLKDVGCIALMGLSKGTCYLSATNLCGKKMFKQIKIDALPSLNLVFEISSR